MRRHSLVVLSVLMVVLTMPQVALGDVTVAPGGGTPGTSSNFQLVGHDSLFGRGMNAGLTVFDHYVYVGNRTDGSDVCGVGDPRAGVTPCPHPHPGILIVDVADPAHPSVVGEIGPPYAGQVGITTRELRVWPQQKLLAVMTFRCSSQIHACPPGNDVTFPFDLKFFDLTDPIHPRFLSSYIPTSKAGLPVKPHEMYLWADPNDPDRALLWLSTPSASVPPAHYAFDLALHPMAPTADATTTYLAHLRGGMGVLDTSEVVADTDDHFISLNDKLLTPIDDFVRWGAGNQCAGHTMVGCSESHSAVPVPGRPFELSTDEVYGTFTVGSFGWPWGWARLINVAQPKRPHLVGEYKIFQNTQPFQGSPGDDPATEQFTSYSSHNPTLTRDLALIAWHSGGLQAIDIADPGRPAQGGWFSPTPLATVANEDPALSAGPNKVVMWSYPIVKDGLVYVIDIRNGLYILRYTGPQAREVAGVGFLEGNSNLGDAVRIASSNRQ